MRITQALKQQVLNEANWKCEYCGIKLDESSCSIDHKMPRSKGGSDERENLAAACRKCNMQKADKVLEAFSNPIAKQAATAWIHAYIKSPKTTSILSFIIGVLGFVFAIYFNTQAEIQREAKLSQDLNFKSQIEQLENTESSLKQLLEFIKLQKIQVTDNQTSLETLVEEKNKLEPLVSADKKVVEALFSAQEARAIESAKAERWIGFWIGVVASIIASIVLMIFQYFLKVRSENS
ncbi:HNH endonuclease [Pseudoalteromonas sp. Scap03]|nr:MULTISPECIES: HNH endonuclease signature motif containing protein [unclassified Pseudoalteromonas]NWL17316.1 HNH endonuclease [Pseudoalteromonas sp. Scap03]QLE83358.1 HNH endonuclease [Pseudoalteromonas sp. Scap25]QLE91300.1 HNH endonuclease [Pseudoalteromonas sp. Scap06]